MIQEITVENFRAFQSQRLRIRPLTILVGPNNSGKSALISALTLLSQSMRSRDPDIALLLQGPLQDFGTYRDVVYKNHAGRRVAFDIEIEVPERSPRRRAGPSLFDLEGQAGTEWPRSVRFLIKFKYRTQRRHVVVEELTLRTREGRQLLHARYSDDTESVMLESLGGQRFGVQGGDRGRPRLRLDHFVPLYPHRLLALRRDHRLDEEAVHLVSMASMHLARSLEAIEFLGPFRAPPARTYLFSGETPGSVGPTGERAVEVLVSGASRRRDHRPSIRDRVSKWMHQAGVAKEMTVHPLTDRHFEVRVAHPVTQEEQNIADAGYGCSQVFPVLVGGFSAAARRGSMFIVEQPELHLHPRAQAELAAFFLDLVAEGCCCVIETHSEHLVVRLQSYLADPEVPLRPEEVALYYVYPGADGHKVVKEIRTDETGGFLDEWPQGFFPERLDEARRLARMALKRGGEE